MATLLNGKIISQKIKDQLKITIAQTQAVPGVAVILVGNDPASKNYVENKTKACKEVGIHSELFTFDEATPEKIIIEKIMELNNASHVNGILVQLPLPGRLHSHEQQIMEAISPDKDIDGLHPMNIGRFMNNKYLEDSTVFLPCTPYGVIRLLEAYAIPIEGKHVVVLGRSNLVGKPVGMLFLAKNATVTFCHSKSENIKAIAKQADILVSAIGKPKMIDEGYVKKGAVVVDVGFNYDEAGLSGDVDFASVEPHASAITPVPGGVGQMTVAILMENIWKAYTMQNM